MTLDVLSTNGQMSILDEQKAKEIFTRNFPIYSYIETPKGKPAFIDAFLTKNDVIERIVETKCRYNIALDEFYDKYGGHWLITFEKLEKAKIIANSLQVDMVGFLYLVKSETLLVQKIIENGDYVGRIVIEKTKTQKNINNGTIERVNAFINMNDAWVLK